MRIGSIADIREQARRFRALLDSPELANRKRIADAWCAAFVYPKQTKPRPITSATLQIMGGDEEARMLFAQAALTEEMERELDKIVEQYGFFHWHLEFPDVFRVGNDSVPDANHDTGWQGGFTCVLGNPPWEKIELKEQEFFSDNKEIAQATNASVRKKLIQALAESENPTDRDLYEAYQDELRESAGWSQFLRGSGRYPLTGTGRLNTYAVFAEAARTITGQRGRSGLVLPTGIATDATTAPFFKDLVSDGRLVAFLEFENEEFLLSRDVDHRVRFCLISMTGRDSRVDKAEFSFGARQIADVEHRRFTMPPSDILLLNPNTGTAPLFRSRRDAQITLDIYRRIPVLWRENPRSNPWGLSFMQGLFNMATDARLFRRRVDLEHESWMLDGNIFAKDGVQMLPLYEAKMLHQFDHRFGTYEGQTETQAKMGTLPRLTVDDKKNADRQILPRYWVPEKEVLDTLADRWDKKWLIGWRDIARSTDERTMISSVLPVAAVGHTFPIARIHATSVAGYYANSCAFILDYLLRQKMAGTHLTYGYLKQLPFLPPKDYDQPAQWDLAETVLDWVQSRVLELTYVARDLKAFAQELGDEGPPFIWDEERRFAMRAELDAAYFHLYGVTGDDVGYIMDSFGAFQRNDPERFARTKARILDVYDAMVEAVETGEPYKTILDPPPGEGLRHQDR